MSYNPARASGKARKKTRRFDPKAGVKHSDIMRKNGVGFEASSASRVDTRHGFTSELASFEDFTQRYACLFAGNNTGIGYTDEGNRTVRVMVGTLYVTYLNKVKRTSDDGQTTIEDVAEIKDFSAGHTVSFPAGTRYSLAASGTSNVELLITETAGYAENWKELEDSTVTIPDSVTLVPSRDAAPPPRRPRGESKAYQQAQSGRARRGQVKAQAENRKVSRTDNVNSSTVVGVNPRPSGPPPADD